MGLKSVALFGVATALVGAGLAAGASGAPFAPKDIHGERVGPNTLLWAHVFRAGKPGTSATSCVEDTNTSTTLLPAFALPKTDGIVFRPAPENFNTVWRTAVADGSFAEWNATGVLGGPYFSFGDPAPAVMAKPSKFGDGRNYMGLAALSGRTLAVAYTWSNRTTGRVIESDVFFNNKVSWTTITETVTQCPYGSAYDREAIATHELGHVLGFDHLNVLMATMYPSANPGETRKRSLTAGEKSSAATAATFF